MTELPENQLLDKTFSQTVSDAHAIEHAHGWQYCRVWRFARPTDPNPVLGPPQGEGWERNRAVGDDSGRTQTVPAWSDGSVIMQKTHWRRRHAGILKKHISEQVRWDGDPHPNG